MITCDKWEGPTIILRCDRCGVAEWAPMNDGSGIAAFIRVHLRCWARAKEGKND